jgi:hypothetical protein
MKKFDQIIPAQSGFLVIDLDCRGVDYRPPIPVVAWRLTGDGSVTPITLFGLPLRWAIVMPPGNLFDMSGRYFSKRQDLHEANRAVALARVSTSEGDESSEPQSAARM